MATKKKPAPASIETKVQAARDEATVKAVSGLTADTVAAKLATASVEIQKKLAEVGGVVSGELAQLDDIRRTIELKKAELKDLYGIEAAVVELDKVKAEAEAVRESIQQEREAWEREAAEGDANIIQARKRAEDEYAYQTALKRRKEEDAHRDKMAAAETAITAREAAVKAAEKELADLRAQVTNIPSLLEAERKKVAAAVTAEARGKYETEIALAKKDADAAAAIAANSLAAAKEANAALAQRNTYLEKEIEKVRADAKDIAAKALEAGNRPTVFQVPSAPAEPVAAGRGR